MNPGQLRSAAGPAVNVRYLTGTSRSWPLEELYEAGYRGIEVTPDCLADPGAWLPAARRLGMDIVAVNAMPWLRPYLTGSLSDNVAWRRRATIARLKDILGAMTELGIPRLLVAPSRLAEVYQTPDEARALLVGSLRELAHVTDREVLLVAAPFRLFWSSSATASVVDEIARPNVGAGLDVGHALLADEQPDAAAAVLGNRLRYLQVHDAGIRPGRMRVDQRLVPGEGSLRRDALQAALSGRQWTLNVTARDDPVGAARRALAWLGEG